ncbi:nucleoside triphosphate pyrophosphatase [Actibacterium sp. 188UL27-1]|uniref:Maf family protein n=1 Tax=Actibacterium sp. 188UL27-1 TaxID=2786961 RepID=UPI00195EA877|nr:Maf family nucleotide pyrophosphatase [Actibacterium sp. 188UL27-1]MBM7067267.1 septum formation protein Maf [Actibacterium sp. 188UL27-1]
MSDLILASGSPIRRSLLERAGIRFAVEKPRVDEDALRKSLTQDDVSPRDMSDALADFKARRVASKTSAGFVLAADQILEFDGAAIGKSRDQAEAAELLSRLQGQQHKVHSAVVIYENAKPVWRHVATATLTMRALTANDIDRYLSRHWLDVSYCVGHYRVDAEGIRLFQRIDGDYFTVLGIPLLQTLNYLSDRGVLEDD